LDVANAGTGTGLYLDQAGAGIAAHIHQAQNTTGVRIHKAGTGAGVCLEVVNAGTGYAALISQTGVGVGLKVEMGSSATGYGLSVAQTAAAGTAYLHSTASGAFTVLDIVNEGTGPGVRSTSSYDATCCYLEKVQGSLPALQIANGGTGNDITADTWSVSPAGYLTIPTVAASGLILTPKGRTISSSAITIDATYSTITLTGTTSTDDLATISGGTNGQVIILRCHADSDSFEVVQSGNITLTSGASVVLEVRSDRLVLQYDSDISEWCELSYSGPS
jgi:hypothetical protein